MNKLQRVVVAGALIESKRVLIIRRARDEVVLPDYWELPGGKVHFGEAPSDALVREFKEETNIDVQPLMPFSVFDYTISSDERFRHTIQINYIVKGRSDSPVRLSAAHSAFHWAGSDEIQSLDIDVRLRDVLNQSFTFSP